MTDGSEIKPLAIIVDAYLWIHEKTSLRALLFGPDPTKTPRYITAHHGRWINRDTLVDLYAIGRILIDRILLWLVVYHLREHRICALLVGLFTAHRLNELLGVIYILLRRARADYADGRKLAITLLAYLEPIILFAILHGVISIVLSGRSGSFFAAGYSLGSNPWTLTAIVHYVAKWRTREHTVATW